jgi:L-threonylcarbamoyladenylate synthase
MPQISDGNKRDLQAMAKSLIEGYLVAIPTETVYGIAADAMNEYAVKRMYEVKGRPENHPVIVHISKFELINFWALEIPEYLDSLIKKFWPGPLTIILRRSKNAGDWITGGQDTIGLRMPKHEKTLELLNEFHQLGGKGLAAPSANKFGRVSPTSFADVLSDIGMDLNNSDWVLDGGKSKIGIESTIVDCREESPKILRPGAISKEIISKVFGRVVIPNQSEIKDSKTRVSGLLAKHYSPTANVRISNTCNPGEGFIAMRQIPSPKGSIRLNSPLNLEEFASDLYISLRKADELKLPSVVVAVPEGDGLAEAIRDRIYRAAGSP